MSAVIQAGERNFESTLADFAARHLPRRPAVPQQELGRPQIDLDW